MVPNCVRAQVEHAGDLRVGLSARQELEHLELPVGEKSRAVQELDRRRRSQPSEQLDRDAGGEQSSSCCRGTNPGDERFRRGALDEVANGSRQHGLEHVLLGTGDREHQDAGRGIGLL